MYFFEIANIGNNIIVQELLLAKNVA